MKLMILDGNSIVNRAFYGIRQLNAPDGTPTNAVYGFIAILQRLLDEQKPDALCVSFDLKAPTFRHKRYDGYKAQRKPMPEELAVQIPLLKDTLDAMGIKRYELEGYEADDILGTVARICESKDWDCVIVTGDKDSLQLITERTTVCNVKSRLGQTETINYTPEVFREDYGFEPLLMVDLKALMGDSSDNIPGVAGVGPKTATELLLKFGSLDGVYENLDDSTIRPKLREKLEMGRENAYLSYDLAIICPEAPIDFEPKDAIVQPYNRVELYRLFQKLEFVKLIDKYGLRGAEQEIVRTEKKGQALPRVDALPAEGKDMAVYVAPDGSLGVAWEEGACAVTPMEALQLSDFFIRAGKLYMHDSKATMHLLDGMALSFGKPSFDTALAAYDLNPSQSDYPISKLATNFLGITVDDNDCIACAEAIWNLRSVLEEELQHNEMQQLYYEIELPLCSVLYNMEKQGVAIDREQLSSFGQMLGQRIADCENLIYSYSGDRFNINSTKQLGELLFDQMGLPPIKKTKTGYSTNADVLEKLKDKHPIIPAIMDYRMLTKLKSTYSDGLMNVICDDDRIRTTFQNLVTATGRLSSSDPNLQNIPVRSELGAEIRKMFVPKPGCVLVDADYSQIELRVLAHIAADKAMCDAFVNGLDIHSVTASQVFGVPVEAVTPLQRRNAKAVNFGIVYGISEFSLAEDIGVSRYEAKAYIDGYLDTYPGVKRYMRGIVESARDLGYTKTMYGRKRYIPELKSSNFNIRQGAERIALNTPIQGTAADLIKLAMIRVFNALEASYPEAKLLLQVHDELIVECPEEIACEVAALISAEMEQVAKLDVPLLAEAKWGKSWYDAK